MSARESDDIITDDITADQDVFYAAVKEEVDVKTSVRPAFTPARVKVEPVDCDGVSTSDCRPTGKVDILWPPIEEVDVDPPPIKTETDQEYPRGRHRLDIPAWQDHVLLTVDAKREEPTPSGTFPTSSYIKEEPYAASLDQRWPKSVTCELDALISEDPLLLPGNQEEGRVSVVCSAAVKQEGESDALASIDPLLLPGKQEGGGDSQVFSEAVQEEVAGERSSLAPFVCDVCKAEFARKPLLRRHISTHGGNCSFSCVECLEGFKCEAELKQHLPCHSATRSMSFVCSVPSCRKRYSNERQLKCHRCARSDSEVPFACEVPLPDEHLLVKRRHQKRRTDASPSASLAQGDTLKWDVLIRAGESRNACSVCNEHFTLRSNLKRHMIFHVGEKPHVCPVCGQSFTRSSHLKVHALIHKGEKPHACSACGKRFTQSGTLTRHMLFHTGEKPHECSACGKRFGSKRTLGKHHLRIHTGEKSHACSLCSASFAFSDALKHHLLNHAEEKPQACSCAAGALLRTKL